MKYFYLEGVEKKGPFEKEELIFKKLNSSTLIFCEGMESWTQLSQIPELNKIENLSVEIDSKKSKKIKIHGIFFLILGLIATTGISFVYTQSESDKDLQNIESKVQEIFQGKDEICDFKNEGVIGKLEKHSVDAFDDNEGNPLVEYYKAENIGWTVLTLTKLNNGFSIVESNSTDMGFKVPKTKNYLGYSMPTYRGSVQNAYNESMEYKSKEKENNSYVAGSYLKIKAFDQLSSDFHSIENIHPTKNTEGISIFKGWQTGGSVFNANWIVWYRQDGKHYEIVENKELFDTKWLKYSLISGLIAILMYLLIRYRKKITLQVT